MDSKNTGLLITKTLLLTLLQKKARAALLLFSIAVCASLLFANLGFQRTCEQMVYDADTRWSGNSELYIATKQSAGAKEWIEPGLLSSWRGGLEYDYGLIKCKALYAPGEDSMHCFTALGTDIDEFNNYNPLTLQSGSADNWDGDKLIIGAVFARMLDLSVGDALSLEINGGLYEFQVAGVSAPKGLFLRELADGGYLLMPKETMAEIVGGQCNLIFLKVKDPSSVPALKEELTAAFPEYAVNMGVDHEIIRAETNNYVLPFWFSSIMVVFMSVFIIYSSFNLIVNERISILGILRSAGCTRRKTNRILILESMIIGAAGGAIGSVLGIGVLHVIKTVYFSGEDAVSDAPLLFGVSEIAITIAVSIVITALSAMLPILKVTKAPVKNIILNDFQKQKAKSLKFWPFGFLLLLPCFFVPGLFGKGFTGMITASAAAMLVLIGLNLLIPLLCKLAALAVHRSRHIPQVVALGVRNVGDFKALVNNVRLFASVLAIMVFMMTLFNTLATDLRGLYEREKYDISMVLRESGPPLLARLAQTDGVADFYGVHETFAAVNNYGTFMNAVIGVDDLAYFGYSPAEIPPDARQALEALGDGRYIVTTNILRDKLGLRLGDILTLQFESGPFDYRITGFLDTNYGIGHVGFISSDNYKTDVNVQDYSKILVRAAGNPDTAKNNIQRTLSRDVLSIQTKQEIESANADKVEGIFNAINTYAWFAMFIGFLGITNNMVACFMGRRRNIALYRCIGMPAKGAGLMLVTEAMTIGVLGVLGGLAAGILMMQAVPFVVGVLWGNVTLAAPAAKLAALCVLGIAAMLLSSLAPMVKGRNITIMDNIRYE